MSGMRQALIAGRGGLPRAVAAELDAPLICALQDNLPDGLQSDVVFRLEHLGSLITQLKKQEVTQICFCGAVSRPKIDVSAIDAATLPLVPVLQRALRPGDDGALRAILQVFEEAGFSILEIAPSLLPQSGALSARAPDGPLIAEIATARKTLQQFAAIDEGQACVVRGSEVIAQEDPRGTDAMLADLVTRPDPGSSSDDPVSWLLDTVGEVLDDTADWLSGPEAERARLKGAGAILYKGPKPGQDRRADLPTIGPKTIEGAAHAGLRGVVIETGGVIVLDQPQVIALCDQHGLFLLVQDPT